MSSISVSSGLLKRVLFSFYTFDVIFIICLFDQVEHVVTTDDVSGFTIIKFGIAGIDTHEVEITFNQDGPSNTNDMHISNVDIKACFVLGKECRNKIFWTAGVFKFYFDLVSNVHIGGSRESGPPQEGPDSFISAYNIFKT